MYEAALEASVLVGRASIPKNPPADRRKLDEECALIHTTDWQVGKVTPTYNSEVAAKRIGEMMTHKIERITAVQRHDHPVRRADYMFGGDMVENVMIFPTQPYVVDSTLYEQLFNTVRIIVAVLLHGLSLFEDVHAWFEKGNHGRIGKRGELPSRDNLDLMAYEIARQQLQHETRITWHMLPSPYIYNYVEIGNYKALLLHGDEVKSFGGNIPAFGITRKVTKWKAGGCEYEFSDAYHGHYHTHMELPLPDGGAIYGTGSPESDNDYAREFMAETGDPTQRMHFIDPDKGRVTGIYKIFLME